MSTIQHPTTVTVASTAIDLLRMPDALDLLCARAGSGQGRPLAVASVNLDHIHHFGTGSRWHGALDAAPSSVDWLNLLDGAPVVSAVKGRTGTRWPRLAGSDLIDPLLDRATSEGLSVGFFGGSSDTHQRLRMRLAIDRPRLRVAGYWSPTRAQLGDPKRSATLARVVAVTGVDILIVSLGKPQQELWINEHGARTGARVLLAFGAVVDFLAGRVDRAPAPIARAGLEWAWRLAMEPRRLAHRYLVDGPPAYRALRAPNAEPPQPARHGPPASTRPRKAGSSGSPRRFAAEGRIADVAVIVVTYNNEHDIDPLISSLREETQQVRLRVIVVDNGSTDGTLAALARHPDVTTAPSGGNLGYAGGINLGLTLVGSAQNVLVLNPDLDVERGSIVAMLDRLRRSGAGIVVPMMTAPDGSLYHSLRYEPTARRALGDALFGRRNGTRSPTSTEIVYDADSYRFAHPVDWATGAALMIRRDVVDELGAWDERFFLYSEETDYFRRCRDSGHTAWFEPGARVRHRMGGSGASGELIALMTANRIRYAEKHGGSAAAGRMRAALIVHELVRLHVRSHRLALRAVLDRRSWNSLPRAERPAPAGGAPIAGTIIVPAHDEQAVIARTLGALTAPELAAVEVIVACNGCSDDTAGLARAYPNVRVLELDTASKTAALNAADAVAGSWPRLYLDADIEITPDAVRAVFAELASGTVLAARPAFRYDVSGASGLVRAYYRARCRMPSTRSALWGAGAYAVSEAGHERFGSFAAVTADDLWIDRQFGDDEKRVLDSTPVVVRTPRTASALLAVLRRTQRGNLELGTLELSTLELGTLQLGGTEADPAASVPPSGPAHASAPGRSSSSTAQELRRSARGPSATFDAVTYAAFALLSRRTDLSGRAETKSANPPRPRWARDDTSRRVVHDES